MSVEKLNRDNYEATDAKIGQLRNLILSMDALVHHRFPSEAIGLDVRCSLLEMMIERLNELDDLRDAEWKGLGGVAARPLDEKLVGSGSAA